MPSMNRIDFGSMDAVQVRDFIRSLGSAYERYSNKFRSIKGSQLLKFTEISLNKFGIGPKLHRAKILLEIARNDPHNEFCEIFSQNEVEVLNWTTVKVQEWCSKTQVISIYAHKFFNHGIDGMLLFELDAKDLHTIGVKKIHQQRVLDIIAKFAKTSFLSNTNDDQKDPETTSNETKMNGMANNCKDSADKPDRTRVRGSVAHVDLAQLAGMNGGMQQNQNNDAIIYTMGQLLLELGEMFKVGKVQVLTSRLKQQLNELQANSVHPQMVQRGKSIDHLQTNDNNKENEEEEEAEIESNSQSTKVKMQDHIATSPTGVDAAWIKTQNQAKGHKRRSSLPFINTNMLDQDDEDDDDISDLD